jgi:hypothetical protein
MVIMSFNFAMRCLTLKDAQALLKEFFIASVIIVLENLRVMSYLNVSLYIGPIKRFTAL